MWFRSVDQRQLGKPPGLRQLESRRRCPTRESSRNPVTVDAIADLDTPLETPLWGLGRPESAPALLRGQGLIVQAQDVVKDVFLQNIENHAVRNAVANLRRGYLQTRDVVNDVDCLADTHLMELRVRHNRKQRQSAAKAKALTVETTPVTKPGKRKKEKNGASEHLRNLCKLLETESLAPLETAFFGSDVQPRARHDRPRRADSITIAKDFATAVNSQSRPSSRHSTRGMSAAEVDREVVKLVQFLVARFGTIESAWEELRKEGCVITGDDWRSRLRSMGYDSDPSKIFAALDKDGNDVMTWDELEDGLHALMPGFILKGAEKALPLDSEDGADEGGAALDTSPVPSARQGGSSGSSIRRRLSAAHALDASLERRDQQHAPVRKQVTLQLEPLV